MVRSTYMVWGLAIAAASLTNCVADESSITDASQPSDASPSDAPVDVPFDAPTGCAARTANDATGVFVSKGLGTDVVGCGPRNNPCQTIKYAIATAKADTTKTTIYLSAAPPPDAGVVDAGDAGAPATGAYMESITLDAPLTIEGGWSDTAGTWTPICDATMSTAVTIQGVTDTTVTAAFAGAATLRDLQIVSMPAAADGASLYGIFVTGATTNLTLDAVVVNIAAGGVGVDGTNGVAGASGSAGGCGPGSAAQGSAGSAGNGASAGSFTATGYVTTNASGGTNGTSGTNGAIGGNGTCSAPNGCDTCNKCVYGTTTVCGGQGVAGCAGALGTAGSPGSAGGSSVAVYVWDAHITVFGGSFAVGNGGNGGNGGSGGAGGAGAAGVAGSTNYCDNYQGVACSNSICQAPASATPEPGGSAGTKGGNGGAGGHGGGGSGGDSYAFVQGGDGGVILNNSPTLTHGAGGTGGTVGGAAGTAGNQWP